MNETSIYTFPNLPRVAGQYQMYCPTCAAADTVRVVKATVRKAKDGRGLTVWAYRVPTCRKCGTLRDGILPRSA